MLQESWKDLFLLHLSQWAVPWDLSNLLNNRQNSLRTNGHILSIEEEVVDMEIKTMQVRGNDIFNFLFVSNNHNSFNFRK